MSRRSYDHYCPISRALDAVGERWTLLIVRELLTGPCRYSDLLADLPGISTDVLAGRLRDMERDGLVVRCRIGPRGTTWHYELTDEGERLRDVLVALSAWGGPRLAERRPTDALRSHWFALPLGRMLAALLGDRSDVGGTVDVRLDEGAFRVVVGADGSIATPRLTAGGEGQPADLSMRTTATTASALVAGELDLAMALANGSVTVTGEGTLATALRTIGRVPTPTPAG